MKRVCGFAMFFVAIGLLLGLCITNMFVEVMIMLICVTAGYILFCK